MLAQILTRRCVTKDSIYAFGLILKLDLFMEATSIIVEHGWTKWESLPRLAIKAYPEPLEMVLQSKLPVFFTVLAPGFHQCTRMASFNTKASNGKMEASNRTPTGPSWLKTILSVATT